MALTSQHPHVLYTQQTSVIPQSSLSLPACLVLCQYLASHHLHAVSLQLPLRSVAVFPGGRALHTVRAGLMRHLPNGLANEERSGRKNESSLVKSSVLGTISLRAAEQCRGSLQRSVSLLKSLPPEPVSSLRCLFPNLPTQPSLIALCFCESLFI
jgi:hypothetical protein